MEKIANEVFESVVKQFEEPTNKEKLKECVLNPVIRYIGEQLMPYVICAAVAIAIVFFILIYLAYITHKLNKSRNVVLT